MAYRFKLKEKFSKGVARIGLEQFQRAIALLESAPPDQAVHETRKCLKRLRALLRLVRPGIGRHEFKICNGRLRDIARKLSGARDQVVMVAMMHQLAQQDPALQQTTDRLERSLIGAGAKRRSIGEAHLADVVGQLQEASTAWSRLALRQDNLSPMMRGLEHTYRRCRRAYAEAIASGEAAAYHEWRKTVQQHWRHMRLLEAGWPAYFQARAELTQELSELLGVSQDLSVLIDYVDQSVGSVIGKPEAQPIVRAAQDRQRVLRKAVRPRAERLFAEGVHELSERVAFYWANAAGMPRSPLESTPTPKVARPDPVGVIKQPTTQPAPEPEAGRLQAAALRREPVKRRTGQLQAARAAEKGGGTGQDGEARTTADKVKPRGKTVSSSAPRQLKTSD